MIIGAIIPLIILILIILLIRKVVSRDGGASAPQSFSIRRLFQYGLLFGLVIVVSTGLSGLIGRALDFRILLTEDKTSLARNLSFVMVGIPLLWLVARWSSRNFKEDSRERLSFGWNAYLYTSSVTALIISLYALHDLYSWIFGEDSYRGNSIAQLIVWGGVWFSHWHYFGGRNLETNLVTGSVIGLGMTAVGAIGVIGNSIVEILGSEPKRLLVSGTNSITNGAITLLIGFPLFYLYWVRNGARRTQELLKYTYLFLIGITGGFILTIVSLSIVTYKTLVWIIGNPIANSTSEHFSSSAMAIGGALVGVAVWSYHRSFILGIDSDNLDQGKEIRRIYQYIISGIALISSSVGLLMIFIAVMEALAPAALFQSQGGQNTLLLAVTLLVIGVPIWWKFWSTIEFEASQLQENRASLTRRTFLLMLFGVSSVASVISILTFSFLVLDDILNSQFGDQTLREVRYPLGILLANGAIAGYHWNIYRGERSLLRKSLRKVSIILVGPSAPEFITGLKHSFDGSITNYVVDTPESGMWNIDEAISAIDNYDGERVLLMQEGRKLKVIPLTSHERPLS
jgi:hypothetical protein